jgi:hypothetical protein
MPKYLPQYHQAPSAGHNSETVHFAKKCIYVFRVALTLEAINRLISTRDTECGLCELGPGLLYITPLNVGVKKDKNFFSLGSVTF